MPPKVFIDVKELHNVHSHMITLSISFYFFLFLAVTSRPYSQEAHCNLMICDRLVWKLSAFWIFLIYSLLSFDLWNDLSHLFNLRTFYIYFKSNEKPNLRPPSLFFAKIIFPYTIDNKILKRVSRIKDLGIIFDDKLSFTEHIDDITRKSYRMLGFIFRCGKYFVSQYSMRILYSSLVRNRLEYCSTVWNPFYNNAIDQIERVQKKVHQTVLLQIPNCLS